MRVLSEVSLVSPMKAPGELRKDINEKEWKSCETKNEQSQDDLQTTLANFSPFNGFGITSVVVEKRTRKFKKLFCPTFRPVSKARKDASQNKVKSKTGKIFPAQCSSPSNRTCLEWENKERQNKSKGNENRNNEEPAENHSTKYSTMQKKPFGSSNKPSTALLQNMKNVAYLESEGSLLEIQKKKLLRKLAFQQQQILKEEKELDKKIGDQLPRIEANPDLLRMVQRDDVISKCSSIYREEEQKATKVMTHLLRRRNSIKLKANHFAREIASRSGKKRRQDHQRFAAIESKLNDMKSQLSEIDREILEQQAKKQDVVQKNRQRQELKALELQPEEPQSNTQRQQPYSVSSQTQIQLQNSKPRDKLASIGERLSVLRCKSSGSMNTVQPSMSQGRTEASSGANHTNLFSVETRPVKPLHSPRLVKSRKRSNANGNARTDQSLSASGVDHTILPSSSSSSSSCLATVICTSKADAQKAGGADSAVQMVRKRCEEISRRDLQVLRSRQTRWSRESFPSRTRIVPKRQTASDIANCAF